MITLSCLIVVFVGVFCFENVSSFIVKIERAAVWT